MGGKEEWAGKRGGSRTLGARRVQEGKGRGGGKEREKKLLNEAASSRARCRSRLVPHHRWEG